MFARFWAAGAALIDSVNGLARSISGLAATVDEANAITRERLGLGLTPPVDVLPSTPTPSSNDMPDAPPEPARNGHARRKATVS